MKSKIKEIYIIRHGETDFNRIGIVQGSGIDSDLNLTGQRQALAFYNAYKHILFDKIYTSKLKRTHQSVVHFLDEKKTKWQQEASLNEISWGNREGKLPDNEDNLSFAKMTKAWQDGHTHLQFEEGESPEEVANRQAQFIKMILENYHEKIILVAMHGRALKILLAKLIENDITKMDSYEHSNLCLYKMEYNYNSSTFKLIIRNSTDHLK